MNMMNDTTDPNATTAEVLRDVFLIFPGYAFGRSVAAVSQTYLENEVRGNLTSFCMQRFLSHEKHE